jgi:hypothetical protein
VKKRELAPVNPLGGTLSHTGWTPKRDLSYEEWAQVGEQLQTIHRSIQWWVGDWLNYGERAFGETYTQAIEVTGLALATLQNIKWVAANVAPSVRREGVDWTTHGLLAPLEPHEQAYWLDAVEAEGLSSRALKERLKDAKAAAQAKIVEAAESSWLTYKEAQSIASEPCDIWFLYRGPCELCGHADARHRLYDAIRERSEGGEDAKEIAADFEIPIEAVEAALERDSGSK